MSRSSETPTDHRQDTRTGDDGSTELGSPGSAMVLGILGAIAGALALGGIVPLMLGIVGLVLAVAGLVAGVTSYTTAKDLPRGNTGAAIGGILLSALALVLSAIPVIDISSQFQDLGEAVEQLEQEGTDVAEGDLTD
jgi:hypothetical protein